MSDKIPINLLTTDAIQGLCVFRYGEVNVFGELKDFSDAYVVEDWLLEHGVDVRATNMGPGYHTRYGLALGASAYWTAQLGCGDSVLGFMIDVLRAYLPDPPAGWGNT